MHSNCPHRTRKQQHGAALIELALIIPLLLLLTFITTEFGRAMYEYHALVKSVRDAARYLSVHPPGTHVEQARNLMVYGSLTAGDKPLVSNLTLANVPADTCCTWQPTGTAPIFQTVTVRITGYTFEPMVSGAFGVSLGGILSFPPITATMRAPT
jgi:hypothetical protein